MLDIWCNFTLIVWFHSVSHSFANGARCDERGPDEFRSFICLWIAAVIFVSWRDNAIDHINNKFCETYLYFNERFLIKSAPSNAIIFSAKHGIFFLYIHKMKWSGPYSSSCFSHSHTHMQTLLMSWLCLLVVHSVIEMGVWVLSGRKSACQLAFSALFPISIKHLHHLLWAHSATPHFSPEPCTPDRWYVLGSDHFSSCARGHVTLCFQCLFPFFFFSVLSGL